MGVAFLAIIVKLAYIQAIGSSQYVAVGQSEWTHTVTLAGARGAIVDRNGHELAMSIPQTTLYADPHQVTDPLGEAGKLAPVLNISATKLRGLLSENAGFVYLDHTVDDGTAAAVKKLNLDGVYSLEEPKRFYPAGQLASALIGSVGTDGTGLGGLESMYNQRLQGQPGKLIEKTDPQGRQVPGGLQQYQAPVAGQDVVTSINQSLQYDAEQALAQAIVAAKAKSGIAMLMDTHTGNILADANLTMPSSTTTQTPAVPVSIPPPGGTPTTSPTGQQAQPVEAPSASGFTQVYEPGSVNKLITISAALQEGVIKPTDTFTIPNSYRVAGTTFHDAESHAPEHWTVTDILANSSNVGTITIAQRLGKQRLADALSAFGFGQPTAVQFPGESAGLVPNPASWSATSIG
ncbi:MAG: peptidoglycan D,D-transpeptidase FtsI family protein, partial [Acidimicrobiales bacterium]